MATTEATRGRRSRGSSRLFERPFIRGAALAALSIFTLPFWAHHASVRGFESHRTLEPSATQHEHHMMSGDMDPRQWRMPPMDSAMPMLPGIENSLPVVGPFLAGAADADVASFAMASPSTVVELEDGDSYRLEASIVRHQVDGKTFLGYGYNGQFPGPLFKAPEGSTITVEFVNNIDLQTTVHWHGLRLDNRFDGIPNVTQPPVGIGESFTYEVHFPDTGVYWYHPHMREDIQQDLGMYGNMLVSPLRVDHYSPVNQEEVLILDDLLMDDLGPIPFGDRAPTHALMGRFGNVMLVNGSTEHSIEVERGAVVRFYLTNVANSRTFNVVFGGNPIKVVASDVSKFEQEVFVDNVVIAPAERYIVEVLFEESGTFAIENSIQAINEFRGEFYPRVDRLATLRVREARVDDSFGDAFRELRRNADVAEDLEAYRGAFDRDVDYELELTLEIQDLPLPIVRAMEFEAGLYAPPVEWNDAMPMMNWLSSAEQVRWILREPETQRESEEIQWRFERGDVIKLRIFNNPETIHPMNHPVHIHGQRFLVLDIDGRRNENLVWKDTTIVPVGSTVDLLVEMSNPGKWMLHCHIAEHLHSGMMLTFEVSD